MNAIFYRDEGQRLAAERSLEREVERLGIERGDVETKILPMRTFTYAEDYHQKYGLTRYREIRDGLTEIYPDAKSLADSTVATRLNAYLSSGMVRHHEALLAELDSYGLPAPLERAVKRATGGL